MNYLIGIDLGTQGTKADIRDEYGKIVGEAFVPSKLLYPEPGAVEQDPEEMLVSVLTSIKDALNKAAIDPAEVAAIAIDGQMAGIMGVGVDGMAVTPYDSWLDTRCGICRQPFLDFGEVKVIQLTGAPVTYAHGPKIIWWKDKRPEIYRKIHKFVQPGAYCAMRMCGIDGDDAFIDHTYLHFSGFADTQNRRWSTELLDALGVDVEKMPRIVRPTDLVGRLTTNMAAACGLHSGIPVAAGCGDTAASIFGAGVLKSGTLLDVAGTASVLGCATDAYIPDVSNKTILYAPSVLQGLYFPMAYINGGGMCLKWLRDDVLRGHYSYKKLNKMAEQVPPGSNDLFFLPHFSGRVCPNDTLVRGSFVNLGWKHDTAHLYRAILEGIAYEYGVYADIIHQLIPQLEFERVISVGGGSKSSLFCQIKADVLSTPVSTINQANTASLACCAIAGNAAGLYSKPESLIQTVIELCDTQTPIRSNYDLYQQRIHIYTSCIKALHGVYSQIERLGFND